MNTPFVKTALVGHGPFDFWRKKLYELREAIYKRMSNDGKCPICLGATHSTNDCMFIDIENEICKIDARTIPMAFWKTKLDELRRVIDGVSGDDAMCPICLGSWSCKNDCEWKRIEIEIKAYGSENP